MGAHHGLSFNHACQKFWHDAKIGNNHFNLINQKFQK